MFTPCQVFSLNTYKIKYKYLRFVLKLKFYSMKNILTLLLSVLSLNIFSQEKGFELGIKSGGGVSFLYSMQAIQFSKPNVSPVFSSGVSLVFRDKKYFFIQLDFLYERKSASFIPNYFTGIRQSNNLDIYIADNISLSILPGFKTNGKLKFLLFGGPSVNFLVHSQLTELRKNSNSTTKYIQYDTKSYKLEEKFSFGIVLGTGIQKELTEKVKLNIVFRNNLSIYHPRFNKLNFNTSNIMFGIYYSLGNKQKD